jgi:hypothetical protein
MNSASFRTNPSHLTVRHLQESADTSHPLNEPLRIQKWPTTLAGVHLRKLIIPLVDEVDREIKFTTLDQAFIIYTPVPDCQYMGVPSVLSLS